MVECGGWTESRCLRKEDAAWQTAAGWRGCGWVLWVGIVFGLWAVLLPRCRAFLSVAHAIPCWCPRHLKLFPCSTSAPLVQTGVCVFASFFPKINSQLLGFADANQQHHSARLLISSQHEFSSSHRKLHIFPCRVLQSWVCSMDRRGQSTQPWSCSDHFPDV